MPTVIANRLPRIIICALGVFLLAPAASGQTPPASEQTQAIDAAAGTAQPSGQVATLTYANRPIVEFRATVMSRTPAERVIGANFVLARLVDEHPRGIVGTSVLGEARVVNIDGRVVFVILPQDVDVLIDETIDRKTEAAAAQLQLAYNEVVELRTPSRLVRAVGLAVVATLVYFVVLALLVRGHRASARRLSETAQRRIERLPGGEIISRASRATELVRHLTAIVWMLLALLVTDMWLTFVLRRFPYTRPWGESMRASALHLFGSIGEMFVNALPGLGTVVVVVLITRIFTRLAGALFDAVDRRSVALPGIYPETAQPTRRIVVALLWLFALIVSYRLSAGQRFRRLQRRECLRRPDCLTGLNRHHESDHERLHDHLLAGASRRRLREGGGCRRDRHAHWPARDEDQDAASRRGHDAQRHRDLERDDQLLARCRELASTSTRR